MPAWGRACDLRITLCVTHKSSTEAEIKSATKTENLYVLRYRRKSAGQSAASQNRKFKSCHHFATVAEATHFFEKPKSARGLD
jgi:hypothetical protein